MQHVRPDGALPNEWRRSTLDKDCICGAGPAVVLAGLTRVSGQVTPADFVAEPSDLATVVASVLRISAAEPSINVVLDIANRR